MSITRTLATPLFGAAAAGVVLYGVGTSLAQRTHQVTDTLHNSSRSLRRLAEVDDTQDVLKRLHIADDTQSLAEKTSEKHAELKDALPSAYQRPSKPSLTESVKSRWNHYLISFSHVLSDTDADKIITNIGQGSSKVYSLATGKERIQVPELPDRSQLANAVRSLTPNAPGVATLRTPVSAVRDARLDVANTHYMGQGTSLR